MFTQSASLRPRHGRAPLRYITLAAPMLGTTLVKDINPGASDSGPGSIGRAEARHRTGLG